MSYAEIYITPTGAATNGGSGVGSAKYTLTTCVTSAQLSGATHSLTNTNATGWGTTAAGDWICFDTVSTKKLFVVKSLSYLGDAQVVEAVSLLGTGAIALTGKSVAVGGAWNTLSSAAPIIAAVGGANYDTAVAALAGTYTLDKPRLNILTGTNYTETTVATMGAWTITTPLRIESYTTSAGDINHWTSTTRSIHDFGAATANHAIQAPGNRTTWYGVEVRLAHATTTYWPLVCASTNCLFVNCKFLRTAVNGGCASTSGTPCFFRCIFQKDTAGNASIVSTTSNAKLYGCEIVGPGKDAGNGNCFRNSSSGGPTIVLRDCILRGANFGVDLAPTANLAHCEFSGCDFYALKTAINFDTGATDYAAPFFVAYDNAIDGVDDYFLYNGTTGPLHLVPLMVDFNMVKSDCTTPVDATIENRGTANQTGLANLLNNPAASDFTLHASTLALGDGFPGVLAAAGAGYTGNRDPGALQRAVTAGGGLLRTSMTGGIDG